MVTSVCNVQKASAKSSYKGEFAGYFSKKALSQRQVMHFLPQEKSPTMFLIPTVCQVL